MLLSTINVQLHSSRHECTWLHSSCVFNALLHLSFGFLLTCLLSFSQSEPQMRELPVQYTQLLSVLWRRAGCGNTQLMKSVWNKSQQSCIKSRCVPKGCITKSTLSVRLFSVGILGACRKWGRLNLLDLLSQHVSAVWCCIIVQLSVEP